MNTDVDILTEAKQITEVDRAEMYGPSDQCFINTAKVCNILNIDVREKNGVAMFMIAHKLVREAYKHKRDNLVDLCGYARLLQNMYQKENKTSTPNDSIDAITSHFSAKEN